MFSARDDGEFDIQPVQVYTLKRKLRFLEGKIVKATAKDLRFHSRELIETVKRGEEVVITFRGKPCAKLVPFENEKGKASRHPAFGIWKDHDPSSDVGEYVRNLRKGRF